METAFVSLGIEEIAHINQQMVRQFGGTHLGEHNLKNPDSLQHILWRVQGSLFGHDSYPDVISKAAAVGWHIISRHVFHDGNKRTGMESCRLILELNGYKMTIDQETVDVAFQVAKSEMSLGEFTDWVRSKVTTLPKT